jgi:hypothetical protein
MLTVQPQGAASANRYSSFASSPGKSRNFMPSKISTGFILFGSLAIFAALCVLPAALAKDAESSLLGMAAALFSMGALVIACGVYLKARVLQSQAPRPEAPAAGPAQRGGCELCGKEAPVVRCKVHQLDLCGACLARHYDNRSCTYIPSSNKNSGRPSRAMAAKGRGF